MSQNNPKYKRLEALLSEAKSVEPEPNRTPVDQEAEALKVQIPQPDATPAVREEVLKIQPADADAKPEAQKVESLEAQAVTPDAKLEADVLKTQAVMMEAKPVGPAPVQPAPGTKPAGKISFKLFQRRSREAGKTEKEEAATPVQRQLALWVAGIFTLLGVVFLIFSVYNVFILQKGHFDPSDLVLTPVTILMVAFGLTGFILIQRGHLIPGLWLIFGVAIVPPILAVLVLGNVFAVALVYIVTLAFVMITWVFPRSERQKAILVAAVFILIMVGIEFWNPGFRITSTALQSFAPFAIGLAVIGLVAFFIRQAAIGSIRTKLITAFVLMALLSMGVVAYLSLQSMRSTLTTNIGGSLNNLAKAKAVEIGQTVKREYDLVSSLAIRDTVRDEAVKANRVNVLNQAAINTLDQKWRAADAADNNADPLVASVLENELSAELARFKERFPQHVEVFLTDRQGVNVASTNRTSDYYQGDEKWWQTAYQQGVYIGQPEYDESSHTVAINMASAVYAKNGKDVVGVLRTTVDFTTLSESLVSGRFGQTGKTDIYLPDKLELELEAKDDGTTS